LREFRGQDKMMDKIGDGIRRRLILTKPRHYVGGNTGTECITLGLYSLTGVTK